MARPGKSLAEVHAYRDSTRAAQIGVSSEEYARRLAAGRTPEYNAAAYDPKHGNAVPTATLAHLQAGGTMEGLLGKGYEFLDRGGLGAPASGIQHGFEGQFGAGGSRQAMAGKQLDFEAKRPGLAPAGGASMPETVQTGAKPAMTGSPAGVTKANTGPQRPDPLIQPALANAMQLGKTFAGMSPAGSRAGTQQQPGMQPQPGQQPMKPF